MLVFITGTDTGVGKTVTTCSILRSAARDGIAVHGLKPIETGFIDIRDDRSDSTEILRSLNQPIDIARINLYSFRSPVAPQVAAQYEGRDIDWDVLLGFIRDADLPNRLVLVEGAGGPLVPICAGKSFADLAAEINMPAIVVVGSKLGCINHTLLTVGSLQQRGIRILGYIFNELGAIEPKESADIAVSRESNRMVLHELLTPSGVNEIGYIPYLESRSQLSDVTITPFWNELLAVS